MAKRTALNKRDREKMKKKLLARRAELVADLDGTDAEIDQLQDPKADDLDRAVELNPRYPHPDLIRGNLRLKLKQFRGAIDDSDVVPAAKPDEFRVRFSRGNPKQGLGDDKGACEDWLRTCVMSADSHDIDCRLLECLRDGGAR